MMISTFAAWFKAALEDVSVPELPVAILYKIAMLSR